MTAPKTNPTLICFETRSDCPKLRAAPSSRPWMDNFSDRFAYRCLPLIQANSIGWELLCSHDLAIIWNGGERIEDLEVVNLEGTESREMAASSWFSRGIVTFHSQYVFEVPECFHLLVTGPFNRPKAGISPLTGVVDTQRLPFTFTVNWMMTKPGTVIFEKDEPFALLVPVNMDAITIAAPEIRPITTNPELEKRYKDYQESRSSFIDQQKKGTNKEAWQKFYVKGLDSNGVKIAEPLQRKRSLAPWRINAEKDAIEPDFAIEPDAKERGRD